jgi:short subunit dehydrogenase-like uncharacterized protein
MSKSNRTFDVLIWGATGFTGKLVAEYLLKQYGVNRDVRWAVAGRNDEKLAKLRESLGDQAESLQLITADSHDPESLRELARSSRVIISTVGPYASYGSELVAACVENGTHYCDLAGEVQWIRKMIDRHEEAARKSGARIIHACGFDSIPSDIGVYFLQQESMRRFGKPCSDVKMRVKAMKGAASGGTIASMITAMEEARADRNVARILVDPYSLCPADLREGRDRRDQTGPLFDKDLNAWTAPFIMASINTKIVRRSNALMDFQYGKEFGYQEAMLTGSGFSGRLKALQMTIGLGGAMLAGSVSTIRDFVQKRFLPKPGEGPSREQREKGFYNLVMVGAIDGKHKLTVKVRGDRDPGYGSTCKIIGESGVCLAMDELTVGGGFWTPASAMGDALVKRLPANAGLTFRAHEPGQAN